MGSYAMPMWHCEWYICSSLRTAENEGWLSQYNTYVRFLASWISGQWSSKSAKAGTMFASVMILGLSVDDEEYQEIEARSSMGWNHCCCSTCRPPIEWGRSVAHVQCMCNIPRCANFTLDVVVVGFQEVSYHIPSVTWKVMEVYEG
jgi:hypothetical protein